MLDCTITGVRQDLDLERNVTTTFLVLRLPDGKLLRAAIDDAAAATVVALSVAQSGEPTAALPPTEIEQDDRPAPTQQLPQLAEEESFDTFALPAPSQSLPRMQEEKDGDVRVFGGQDGGSESSQDYAPPPAPASSPSRAQSNVQHLPNGKVIVPSRTVPRNEVGYPIMNASGIDAERLTTKNNADEDGVGSV